MVFRRRTPLTLPQKLRALVLPPGGWSRALSYLRLRLTRISDQPHRVARGIADVERGYAEADAEGLYRLLSARGVVRIGAP